MNNKMIISNKDETVMRIIHYFITKENYKPVIIRGVENEIWLENFDADYKLIRINVNYLHNDTQYQTDLIKTDNIRKSIKKKTYSIKMNVLNILVDYGEDINLVNNKDINSVKVGTTKDVKKSSELLEMFPSLIESLKLKKNDVVEFFKMTEEMNNKNVEDEKVFKKWNTKPSKFSVTNILIAINILIFILMYVFGNGSEDNLTLVAFGANYAPLVKQGEVYRLITSTFIHIGILHLFFNMYALSIIGLEIEKFYGKSKFLIVYLLSGIMGSLASCIFSADYISAGASGAIFGLFGSLLYFGLQYRATLDGFLRSSIMPVIVLNLVIGFVIPGIDVSAHIGGLIAGFMISKILGVDGKFKLKESINSLIFMILLVLFSLFMIFIY